VDMWRVRWLGGRDSAFEACIHELLLLLVCVL
jgi:hypothetical protein